MIKRLASRIKENNRLSWLILAGLFFLLAILAFILYMPSNKILLSPEESRWLKEHPVIRFAPNPDYPPLEFFDENGNFIGLFADYFLVISRNLEIKFEFIQYDNWGQVLSGVRNGQIDGIVAIQPSVSQQEYLVTTSPLLDLPHVIITSIRYSYPLTLESLSGWTLAVVKESPDMEYVKSAYPYITIHPTENDLESLRQVSFEKADAALVNQAVASFLIEKHGITNLRISGDSDRINSYAIGIRKDEPVLFSIMEKGLASVSDKQENEVFRRWIDLSGVRLLGNKQFWGIAFWSLAAVIIILGASITWNNALRAQVSNKTKELYVELTERKNAEKRLNQQLENMSALRAIGVAINASMDLPLTLNILLDQVHSKLNVDACRILLFNPHTRSLEHTAERGLKASPNRMFTMDAGTNDLALKAVQTRKLIVEDITVNSAPNKYLQQLKEQGFACYIGSPLLSKGNIKGVLELYNRIPFPMEPEWMDFLEAMTSQAAIALDNATMFLGLQKANLDLTLAYDATIEGWAKALELKDGNTEGHSKRVTQLTLDLAIQFGIQDEELIHVRRGALLHDIGKMGIPDGILNKAGPLSPDEWLLMKMHPTYAYNMLKNVTYLAPALDIPYSHHEKWDGSGYPQGLKGIRIPITARIFAVIDVWDALTSDRPYRKAWSQENTLQYIKDNAGIHFDPDIVDAFINMISRTRK